MRTPSRVVAAVGGVAAVSALGAVVALGGPGAAGETGGSSSSGAPPSAEVGRQDLAATVAVDGVLERTDSRAVYWQQPPPPPAASARGGAPTAAGGGMRGGGPPAGASGVRRPGGTRAGDAGDAGPGASGGGGGRTGRAPGGSVDVSQPAPSTSRPPTSTTSPSTTSPSTTSTTVPPTSTSSSTSTSTTSTTVPPTSTSSSTSSSSTTSCPTSTTAGSSTTADPCPVPVAATGVSWSAPTAPAATRQARPAPAPTGGEDQGTVTAVAAEGQRVERGDVLFAVDGRPSVLLTGTEPAFRELEVGVDDGADVAQLEENLVALGFAGAGPGDLAVDEHFDAGTAAAVEAWQASLGVEPTGRVELGDVVFSPEAATVVAANAAVGDPIGPGDHVLDVTGDTLVAAGAVPARRLGEVADGSPTLVTLADGSTVSGSVRSVSTEAVRPQDADVTDATLDVTVQLDATDSPAARAGADAGLAVTTATRAGVLAVPVAAVVDGGDGEPAVLVPAGEGSGGRDGRGRPVPIGAGLSAGGWVEVTEGPLAEGDTILLPGSTPEA